MTVDPQDWRHIQIVFERAIQLPAEQRTKFVSEQAQGNKSVETEVQQLLASYTQGEKELENSPVPTLRVGPGAEAVASDAGPGGAVANDAVPGYQILRLISRGGQGVVYEALQLSTKRKVALKMILDGLHADEANRLRFQREVEIAAKLNHPGIVPIYDSGLAQQRYYYAMQFVDGLSLNEYVAHHELSLRDKLSLFVKICDAVDFAHRRGVVHRDLKPANILVDREAQPRVLDFGMAKLRDANAETVKVSLTGQVMGTLHYMSPEQAAGRPQQIDKSSDTYALGVMLYELLTEQLPYDLDKTVLANLQAIQTVEPKEIRVGGRRIDREITTIVLKSLHKDKLRRYASAGELRDDIVRYLSGEPIEAKRDSLIYLFRKRLPRYLVPITIAATLALGVWAGVFIANRRTPYQRAPALAPLDPGEFYTADDLESQFKAIQDMLRHDDQLDQIIAEIKTRFANLKETDFGAALNKRHQTDLRILQELAGFLSSDPHRMAVVEYLESQDRQRKRSPTSSGIVNDIVEQVLQRLLDESA